MDQLLITKIQGTLIGLNVVNLTWYSDVGRQKPCNLLINSQNLVIKGIENIVTSGELKLDCWATNLGNIDQTINPIIASLPLLIYFHEDSEKLKDNLRQLSNIWRADAEITKSMGTIGYALSLALKDQLNPQTILLDIFAYIQNENEYLLQQLSIVEKLIENQSNLHHAKQELAKYQHFITTPIAWSFYYFLTTPNDWETSVNRALSCPYQPQITATLTGILSGAYNGLRSIPLPLLLANDRYHLDWLYLSEQLLAIWAGIYHPQKNIDYSFTSIASPQVMQKR